MHMDFLTETKISEKFSRWRIDQYLAHRFGYLSRSEWQKEIRNGKIYFNGLILKKHDKKLKPGDYISYTGRDAEEPSIDRNYSIIYEDNYMLGINKPGNLPVHPAGVFFHNTLLTLLESRLQMKLHLLHRLDRETSGVILLAKDSHVAHNFFQNFSTVKKTYLALVHGIPHYNDFVIDIPIDSDPTSDLEHKRSAFSGAKDVACTRFIRLASFNGYSIIKAIPYTGRQHQIRVHLKYAGYPIVGDKLYGIDENMYRDFINGVSSDVIARTLHFHRSALHARSLHFYHPIIQKNISIKAPLPEDMRQFIRTKQECYV